MCQKRASVVRGVQILEGFPGHFNTQTSVPGSKHSASVWLGTSLSTASFYAAMWESAAASLQTPLQHSRRSRIAPRLTLIRNGFWNVWSVGFVVATYYGFDPDGKEQSCSLPSASRWNNDLEAAMSPYLENQSAQFCKLLNHQLILPLPNYGVVAASCFHCSPTTR